MNRPVSLLLGIVVTVVLSLFGLVIMSGWQLRPLSPRMLQNADGSVQAYPQPYEGNALAGRQVYQAEGCIYCHSQQVRPDGFGVDIERGLGTRRSVPLDYVHHSPPLLGSMRTGPDLSNIATRQPSATWHHLHLYDARLVSEGSVMPPFRYLYDVVYEDPGAKGFALPDTVFARKAWIIPGDEAKALLLYIEALHQDHSLEDVQ